MTERKPTMQNRAQCSHQIKRTKNSRSRFTMRMGGRWRLSSFTLRWALVVLFTLTGLCRSIADILPTSFSFSGCQFGSSLTVGIFRDSNHNGVFDPGVTGDQLVTGSLVNGELIFILLQLAHSTAQAQCAYEGGSL